MEIIFLKTEKSINSSDIETIDKKWNVVFPLDFKQHYLAYNGGYPELRFSRMEGCGVRINTFYSMVYGDLTIEDSYENLVILEPYLPIFMVPFASDDGGNMFCISTRKDNFGAIYFCDNDRYETSDFLTLINVNFTSFLESLQEGI